MIIKNMTKVVVAVALTLAVTFGSDLVKQEIGLDVTPTVYAGPCTTGDGGGC